jgi:hypothetical protein
MESHARSDSSLNVAPRTSRLKFAPRTGPHCPVVEAATETRGMPWQESCGTTTSSCAAQQIWLRHEPAASADCSVERVPRNQRPYSHFVMDALEREKQSLQLRPDGVNIFLLSRRAWVKQGLPRERDSAVLPKQGQDSAWRRHQTPDHARAVTERCSKKNGTLAVFTQSGNSAPFFQHIRSYWLFLKIRNGSEGRMSLGLFC